MNARKDMGELPNAELVPPVRTGKKAVVELTMTVYVEVAESDDWLDMVNQAKDDLNRRVIETKTFYPVAAKADSVYTKTTVEEVKNRTYVSERRRW